MNVAVVFSAQAEADLDRLTDLLAETDVLLAQETAEVIFEAVLILERHPAIGRRTSGGLRELVISRGRSGYIALYRERPTAKRIDILAIRHQREAGYGGTREP